jgi:hypothetical protein
MFGNKSEKLVVESNYRTCPDCGGDVSRLCRYSDEQNCVELLEDVRTCESCEFSETMDSESITVAHGYNTSFVGGSER